MIYVRWRDYTFGHWRHFRDCIWQHCEGWKMLRCWKVLLDCVILGCSWRVDFRRCRRWMVIIELLQLGLLCFLVGAINNFICLIRVWLFHVFCLYWWACRWFSWYSGGNKWRLAFVIRWAGWRSEPGNTGDTFRNRMWHYLVEVERWGVGKCCSIVLSWKIPGEIISGDVGVEW